MLNSGRDKKLEFDETWVKLEPWLLKLVEYKT